MLDCQLSFVKVPASKEKAEKKPAGKEVKVKDLT
jgi:hypothetical protein